MAAVIDQIWSNIHVEAAKKNEASSIPAETPTSPGNEISSTGKPPIGQNHHGNVLVLGNEASGKFSLVQMLGNRADNKDVTSMPQQIKYGGLTYKNVVFNDDDSAIRGSWGVWQPDPDAKACQKQLNQILPRIANSKDPNAKTILGDVDLVVIALDLSNPNTVMQQLDAWVQLLSDFMQWHCSTDSLEILAQNVRGKWDVASDDVFSLSKNIGLPLLVVGTKSDSFDELERSENFTDEHFNYIQYHLRKECLALGAGLCYTSAKNGQNANVLYHEMLYHIGFSTQKSQPSVIERSSINIPIGWDSLKKIELLQESLMNIDINGAWKTVLPNVNVNLNRKLFEESLNDGHAKTTTSTVASLDELHQNFLQKLQQTLVKTNAQANVANAGKDGLASPMSPLSSYTATAGASPVPSSAAGAASTTQGQATGGDTVLADFFQQLLKKSSTQPNSPAGSQPTPKGTPTTSRTKSSLQTSPLASMLNKHAKK